MVCAGAPAHTSLSIGKASMSGIEVIRDGRIATVVIAHEEHRNAITRHMYSAFPRVFFQLDQDPSVAVVIVRGAGDEAFASGRDVRELAETDHERSFEDQVMVTRAEHALYGMVKPTIAMIHGYCFGGGVGLALCCDIRIADRKSLYAVPPANLGLVYGFDSTRRLTDAVGYSQAKWLLMMGSRIGANRAFDIGLIDEVVAPDELHATTMDHAQRISTRAQLSVRAGKEIVRRIAAGQLADDEDTVNLRNAAFFSRDYEEGVKAFLEHRSPDFS